MQQETEQVVKYLQTGLSVQAEALCRDALVQFNHVTTQRFWFYLGVSLYQQQKLNAALHALEVATQQHPLDIEAWKAGAAVLSALGHYDKALVVSQTVLSIAPNSAECLANVGVAIEQVINNHPSSENITTPAPAPALRLQDAITYYIRALDVDPNQPVALTNLSVAYLSLGHVLSAQYCAQELIQYWPNNISGYINLAESYIQLLQFDAALDICERGLTIAKENTSTTNPVLASLYFKYGLVLAYLQQFTKSAEAILTARELDSEVVNDYFPDMGAIAKSTKTEIIAVPELIFLNAAYQQQMRCDWRMRDAYVDALINFLCGKSNHTKLDVMVQFAFEVLSLPLRADERFTILQRVAARYVNVAKVHAEFNPETQALRKPILGLQSRKIRIGYVSPDFRTHPVGLLTASLYALHDRNNYEVYAYSLFKAPAAAENAIDAISLKVQEGCDVYIDASLWSYLDVAKRIKQDEIDILIDLAAYTTYAKFEIFALKPAPIQISYLGYPNTTGAPFIDYILLDKTVCLNDDAQYYSEKVVRLPDAYCPFDTSASNAPTTYTRAENGLPEDAIVFCCFNTNYKIEPQIFACWMRILKAVPNAVLWLVAMRDDVIHRLNAEAALQGVAKNRLIFAHYMPHERHIGRYQLADLFLDTYWHNAHTTAADALWQGLPVITCMGEVQSARLAASLLNALHMPELIANSLQEYEILAIYYATNHQARDAMQAKLKNNRTHAPLFNMPRTVKNIEAAYQTIWQRYCDGLSPAAFDVESM